MGSEYGWGKQQILGDIYFPEYIDLLLAIRKRHSVNYRILLAIATNPHLEADHQKQLWGAFEDEADSDSSYLEEDLDRNAFLAFKNTLSQNPRIIVK